MSIILTRNGIKPQRISKLEQVAMDNLVGLVHGWETHYTSTRMADTTSHHKFIKGLEKVDDPWPQALPFAKTVLAVSDGFKDWGATITGMALAVNLKALKIGDTNIIGAAKFHADNRRMLRGLQDENYLHVRLLCPSSLPPRFANLTGSERHMQLLKDIANDIEEDLTPDIIEADILDAGYILETESRDITIFDDATLHCAQLAHASHKRVLLNADIEMTLPEDWRKRIHAGDQPKLNSPAL